VATRNNSLQWGLVIVVLIVIISGMTIANYNFASKNPGGNDFLVHWVGTRNLVFEGISPYSDETALDIQTLAYGRPARADEHELRVAYPLYSIVVFFPFALIKDFNIARAVWMTTLELALLALSFVSIRIVNWKPKTLTLVIFFLFSMLWYHAVRPLINGNVVILIALGLAGAFLAIRDGRDELAGVLLALTTIKPQVTLVVLVFIVLWAIKQSRWRIIFWLGGSVLLLGFASALLIPDWIVQNLREVLRYPGYNPPGTIIAAMTEIFPSFGRRVSVAIVIILAVLSIVEWWFGRHKLFRRFYWTLCFTLVASQWLFIQTDPGNFIIMMPVLVYVMQIIDERWQTYGQMINIIMMLVLLIGIWIIFISTLEYGLQPQQSPVMFLPLPALLMLLMYWFRWWAIRPASLWYEEINSVA
jgi:hypothetical protein